MNKENPTPKSLGDKFDSILLALLLLLMCSQLTNFALGENTLQTGKGFATKQLFIAFSDIFLLLVFGGFFVRTTALRAWKKLWWPPLPCWALIVAMLIAALHSPTIVNTTMERLAEAQGPKAILKALMSQEAKESKEAIAEIIQFTMYFVIAPLLFVNLMHDRRRGELISRRKLALHAFSGALLLTTLIALAELVTGHEVTKDTPLGAPNALFGSPNIYAAFLALALPLSIANVLQIWTKPLPPFITTLGALALAVATVVSPMAVIAISLGIAVAALLQKQPARGGLVLALIVLFGMATWNLNGNLKPLRLDNFSGYSAHAPRPGEAADVKKQYIEWFAALSWAKPHNVPSSDTGERLKTFATGVGPGNYQSNIGDYYDALPNEEKMPPDSNNLFLVQAVSLGALGLGALVWMFTHFAGLALRTRKISSDWLPSGVLAALVSVLFVNLFHAMFVRGTALVLAFVFSLAAVAWLEARMQPSDEAAV